MLSKDARFAQAITPTRKHERKINCLEGIYGTSSPDDPDPKKEFMISGTGTWVGNSLCCLLLQFHK